MPWLAAETCAEPDGSARNWCGISFRLPTAGHDSRLHPQPAWPLRTEVPLQGPRIFLVSAQAPRHSTSWLNSHAPAQSRKGSDLPLRQTCKAGCNAASSLAPCVSQRDYESIGETHRPNVFIPIRAELPPVVGTRLQSVDEVVVQPEFEPFCVHRQKRIAGVFPHKKLLHARHDLGPAKFILQERNLVQTIGRFHPVAASHDGTSIFGSNVERQDGWLPQGMEAKSIRPLVLEPMLKRSADFQTCCGNKDSQASSRESIGVHGTRGREN